MAKLTLEEWRRQVGDHLQFIEAGAQMAAGRARRLPGRHEWETKAEDELSKARKALEAALADIIAAQETYAAKPVLEQDRAA